MARVDAFLKLGREQGCSDVHLSVGSAPLLRHNGELTAIKYRKLTKEELQSLIEEILSDKQQLAFRNDNHIDFSYQSEEVGRFRVSLYKKIGGISMFTYNWNRR